MKQNYFRHILLCLCLLAGTTLAQYEWSEIAYNAEIDGIYYKLSGNEAMVTYYEIRYRYSESMYGYEETIVSNYTGAVTIPSSVTYNGTTYSVTTIGDRAFYYCSSLTSVTIPESVTSIGNSAFYRCYFLRDDFVNNSAMTSDSNWGATLCDEETADGLLIADHVVVRCRPQAQATSVTIPNSVTSIGLGAFSGCSSLTSITIPESVTCFGDSLYNCSGLTSIIVEEGNPIYDSRDNCNAIIEKSSNELIVGCQSTIIPNSVTSIGRGAFHGCSGLTSITIPESVTSIGSSAFYGCSGLTSITIPESVTSIGYYAFENCSGLTSVDIPNSVTSIGYYAFRDCSGLTDVYCYAEKVPSTSSYAFYDVPLSSATLHVPASALDAYKRTSPWSGFGNIVPLTDDEIDAVEDVLAAGVAAEVDRYNLQGHRTIAPHRGINIIRMSDGTVRKVLVK